MWDTKQQQLFYRVLKYTIIVISNTLFSIYFYNPVTLLDKYGWEFFFFSRAFIDFLIFLISTCWILTTPTDSFSTPPRSWLEIVSISQVDLIEAIGRSLMFSFTIQMSVFVSLFLFAIVFRKMSAPAKKLEEIWITTPPKID